MISLRAFLLTLMLFAASAHGSVIIVGTRVIYPGGSRDVSVRLLNRGDRPALIQAWLDKGDAQSTPESVSVPFALSPSLARIDPERGQVLRLAYTGEPLAQDKESVFWLNVLEVPPKPSASEVTDANILQFALRTRIKVFYRPKGLKDHPADAARALQWRLVRSGDVWSVESRNASAYFVSVGALSLRTDAKAADALATASAGMVAPGETQNFEFANLRPTLTAGAHIVLRYTFIDDYGALVDQDADLSVPAGNAAASAVPQNK
jgi:chaperone protein EcpD